MAESAERAFIRQHFMAGTLDVGSSFETVRQFIELMGDDLVSVIAIEHTRFLTSQQQSQLYTLGEISATTMDEWDAWVERIWLGKFYRQYEEQES